MYDLDHSIANWRATIARNGTCSTDELEELEAHLREEIEALAELGLSEQEAFSIGVSRMGNSGAISSEYAKASPLRLWFRRLRIFLLAAPAIGVGAFAAVFLAPKAQAIWAHADPSGNGPRWILDTSVVIFESLLRYGPYLLIGAVLAMILSDSRARSWSRYQHLPVSVIAFSANLAILVALTSLCLALAIIAPAMAAGAQP